MRITVQDIQRMKAEGRRIPMVTAYDFPSARMADRAGVPLLLVGDSLGQVVHGFATTLPVTVELMTAHASAVVRGSENALVIADLPFLSYASEADAVASARRLMQEAQVQAVKLEGGAPVAAIVQRLTDLGVPVMGHLGYTPQSAHQIGVRVQAKDAQAARRLIDDALLLEASGVFGIVLELVPAALAEAVSKRLRVPTIGIGAGAGCDGQVQVWHDLMGLTEGKSPRHAKRYGEAGETIEAALKAYVEEVSSGAFPTAAQSAKMDPEALAQALRGDR
jgi:3-methyl-2-oxobutanoate hydroxymethyltransferase